MPHLTRPLPSVVRADSFERQSFQGYGCDDDIDAFILDQSTRQPLLMDFLCTASHTTHPIHLYKPTLK